MKSAWMGVAVVVAGLTAACAGDAAMSKVSETNSTAGASAALERLAGRRVFFGHQSVGFNILDGVQDLIKDTGVRGVRIAETTNPSEMQPGTLAHAAVGRNEDPLSKIQAFREHIEAGLGDTADVAMLKFCYIDVNPSTDVAAVFNAYRSMMAELTQRYPDVTFVHATMPLRTVQTGPKALVKTILGRPAGGYLDNRLRNQYNEMLRAEYGGRAPLFDLAAIESTMPDGSRATFTFEGQEFAFLNPAYTFDNGHLNESGRVLAAQAFVDALSASE